MPPLGWIKVNVDGAFKRHLGKVACDGIFRMSICFFKGSFAVLLGIQPSLYAWIIGLIHVVKLARLNKWFPLWIETNSSILISKVRQMSNDVP